MKQYLVIKRYAMDDVPVLLTGDYNKAKKEAGNIEKAMGGSIMYATAGEQDLMGLDIGSELMSVGIITFDDSGRPETMRIIKPVFELR